MEKIEFDIFDFPVAKYRDKRVGNRGEKRKSAKNFSVILSSRSFIYRYALFMSYRSSQAKTKVLARPVEILVA